MGEAATKRRRIAKPSPRSDLAAATSRRGADRKGSIATPEIRATLSYRDIAGEQEDVLIRRYQAGDQRAGGLLVRAHRPLIYNFTKPYFNQGVDKEDLLQEADLGFLYGVERFDPSHGVRLTTYAIYWVRARVGRYLHDHCADVRVPVGVRDAYQGALKHGAETAEEIAQSGYPQARTAAKTIGAMKKHVRIDAPVGHDPDSIGTFADLLAAQDDSPEDQVLHADDLARKRVAIELAISTLTDRERDVITLRVLGGRNGETKTLQEVGDSYGVSRERIRQIEAKAISKLKARLLSLMRGDGTRAARSPTDMAIENDEDPVVEPVGDEFRVVRRRHDRKIVGNVAAFERMIVQRRDNGETLTEIAKSVGIPKSSVRTTLRRVTARSAAPAQP